MTEPGEVPDDASGDPNAGASATATSSGDPLSVRIATAVGAATDTDPLDLPPLAATIDPDAVQDLFADADGHRSLSFDYAGTRVTVTADEPVRVDTEPAD